MQAGWSQRLQDDIKVKCKWVEARLGSGREGASDCEWMSTLNLKSRFDFITDVRGQHEMESG